MGRYVYGLGSLLPVLFLAVGGAGTVAEAQEVPRDTTEVIPLAPVEVTVLRTPVREDMAPFAVAALGEADLRLGRSGAFLDEAIRALPGVHVQNRYNFALGEKVIVRGFGGRAQFGVRGVRVVVDGIPATLPDGQATLDHVDVGSLGRAEVVRGPASALFGNASGGVLALESRLPATAPIRLEAEYVGGSHGLSRIQTTASGTAGGTGYLFNFSTQGWNGFRPNPLATGDVYGTADRIGLNAQIRRSVAGGQLMFTLNHLDLDSENPGELTRSQVEEQSRTAHGAGPVNNILRQAGKEITQTQGGLRWGGPLGTLESDVSVFGVRRSMTNPIVPFIIDLDRDAAGARFHVGRTEAAPLGDLRWHVGVESEVMWDDRLNFLNVNGERGNNTVDQRERVRSGGIFLQVNQALAGGAEALGGLRYDRHDFRAWDHIERGPADPSRTGERTMSAVSPSIGVNVPAAAGTINVFANVGTVYETPSTTELGNRPDGEGGFNPELQPQTGVSGEIGLRGRVGQLLSYELTTYRTDLRNEIVRYQIQAIPGRDFFQNAGRSRHSGAEATLAAASTDGLLDGRVTYTYTNARFRSFETDGVEVGGNRIPGISPQRVEGVFRVNPANLFGEVVTTYVDQVPVNDQNTPGFAAPSYFLVDLRAGMRELRIGSVNVAPWAALTNLFDEYYVASIIPNAAGPNPAAARYYDPGPGRSIQIGIRTGWTGGS
jgi:iron complex outermembrane recepter protein